MPSPARSSPAVPSTPLAAATPTFRRWTIAVTVYIAAVFNRTSLGVAGLEAASRFRITPGQLSVFVLAQLGVYAAMQVPTGLLVDRYGPAPAADHRGLHHGRWPSWRSRSSSPIRAPCWPGPSWAVVTR